MVSLPAGMARMNQAKFLIWTAAGATIWITALAGAGSWLGRRFAALDQFVGPIALIAVGSLVVISVWRVATWKPKPRGDCVSPRADARCDRCSAGGRHRPRYRPAPKPGGHERAEPEGAAGRRRRPQER